MGTYERYLSLTERALNKSRKTLNTQALIELAYGGDTTHLGGNDILIRILDNVLNKISKETVLIEMKRYGTWKNDSIKTLLPGRADFQQQVQNQDDDLSVKTT